MNAIRVGKFGGVEVLEASRVPVLTITDQNQILVKIHAAGVNPVDTYIRSGTYARKPALPYTPGLDGAGVIAGVSDDLKDKFKIGQRVYVAGSSTGTYAEYALAQAHQVWSLPDHINFTQGASLSTPYGTAYRALFQRGGAKKGERVLIHGASGGVGIASIQIAKMAGLKVFGTAGTTEGISLIQSHGCDGVGNHNSAQYREQLMAMTEGKGFDIIIENLANVNLGNDLPMLSPKGRVMVVGSRGPVEILPRDLMSREADIRGVTYFGAVGEEWLEIHQNIVKGLQSGALNPVVGKTMPLEHAAKAHEVIMQGGAQGKIILTTAAASL